MALGIKKVSVFTITLSAVVIWIGFYAWRVMFNNFAVEILSASPTDVGLIQAVREIPGLLAFGAGALALRLTESKIAALSMVVLGLGLILCGASPTILFLGMATVVMSFGFHYFEPTNTSQLLAMAKTGQLGKVQGRLYSYESMAGLAGAGCPRTGGKPNSAKFGLKRNTGCTIRCRFCVVAGGTFLRPSRFSCW